MTDNILTERRCRSARTRCGGSPGEGVSSPRPPPWSRCSVPFRDLGVIIVWHDPGLADRPVGDPGFPDHAVDVDRTEGPRVLAVVAIVTEHEDRPLGHGDRLAVLVAVAPRLFALQVRLVELLAVDVDAAVSCLDRLSGQTDDALDVGLVGTGHRRVEDDDVSTLRRAE